MRVAALFEVGDKNRAEEMIQASEKNGVKIVGLAVDIQCFLEAEKESDLAKPNGKAENGPIVSKPKLRRPPRPLYPEGARENGEQGLVVLEIIVTRSGTVECARSLKGLPFDLTEAALVAVKRAKYEPALKDGEPVAVYFKSAVSFFIE